MKTAMFAHRVYTKDYETGNGISILFVEVQGGDCEVYFPTSWFSVGMLSRGLFIFAVYICSGTFL